MKSLRTLVCGGWIVLCAFAAGCGPREAADPDKHAQEKKPAGNGIDPTTVAIYEKLGATYGGLATDRDGFLAFVADAEIVHRDMPAFRFQSDLKTKLPDVSVPFGLVFAGAKITDEGLKELVGLTHMQILNLNATKVADTGLKELAGLTQLRFLYLDYTEVTDAGLKDLAGLKRLEVLSLSGTGVTDEGLKELAGLKQLRTLHLGGTQVTNAGVGDLQKALLSLRISRR